MKLSILLKILTLFFTKFFVIGHHVKTILKIYMSVKYWKRKNACFLFKVKILIAQLGVDFYQLF